MLGSCVTIPAAAQHNRAEPESMQSAPELATLSARLQTLYPSTHFGEIRATPLSGVFEVAMGANLAYVDASGQYFLFGHLYDMNAQRDLTAVTIHRFLIPIASLHPQARAKAIAVWCAENRLSAWQALISRDEVPAFAECAHPVDRNVALAEQIGVNGTPTLVAADGRVLARVASADEIDAWLSRTAASQKSSAPGGRTAHMTGRSQ